MIRFKVQDFFFDRKKVIDAIGIAKVKYFSKVGAFVRRRAQTSMRRKKDRSRASPPGKPPFAHAGQLREMLFFSYDPTSDSVVVGPVPFRKGEAPGLNEYGGVIERSRGGLTYIATYPARPFMAPALAAEEAKLPTYWQDSVKGNV